MTIAVFDLGIITCSARPITRSIWMGPAGEKVVAFPQGEGAGDPRLRFAPTLGVAVPAVLLDAGGTVLRMNEDAANLIAESKALNEIFAYEDVSSRMSGTLERARAGEATAIDLADGRTWWEMALRPVFDEADNLLLVMTIKDVSDRVRAVHAAEVVSAEMRHRLLNSHAIVTSLINAHARGNPELEAFAAEMERRLGAVSAAQAALAIKDGMSLDLPNLVPAIVRAFTTPECAVVVSPLPCVSVDRGQAEAIAIVLGELAVNSTKHGALKGKGSVRVSASERDGDLTIRWTEDSSRQVTAQAREGGQGFELMKRIAAAHGGDITLDWRARGLRCNLTLSRACQPRGQARSLTGTERMPTR